FVRRHARAPGDFTPTGKPRLPGPGPGRSPLVPLATTGMGRVLLVLYPALRTAGATPPPCCARGHDPPPGAAAARTAFRIPARGKLGLASTRLGLLGRETRSIGPAKGYADPLADAVFWMWHAWQWEPSSVLRAAVTAMWLLVARAVVGVPRKPVLP